MAAIDPYDMSQNLFETFGYFESLWSLSAVSLSTLKVHLRPFQGLVGLSNHRDYCFDANDRFRWLHFEVKSTLPMN